MSEPSLPTLKAQWNLILDKVLAEDRISWLAFFDARLASLEGETLTLDFQDSQKFGGRHDFSSARNQRQMELLSNAIFEVTGYRLSITVK